VIRDFLLHLFPRTVREEDLRITWTFCLGGLAFTCFLVLAASGGLLLLHYSPSPAGAYASILALESEVRGGAYLRSLHRLSSHALLLLLFLHSLRVAWRGAFAPPREMTWVTGALLLLASLLSAYTGYLLPMDQLAYWATRTGMELLRSIPPARPLLSLLVPDGVGEARSLLRFYVIHAFLLPVAIAFLSSLHFWRIRKQRGVVPWL
jgi:quinol-cytochrome oxidoreductase complex cytochrome b subunit